MAPSWIPYVAWRVSCSPRISAARPTGYTETTASTSRSRSWRFEMHDDLLYSIEPDEEEDVVEATTEGELYVALGRGRGERLVPLAFSVPDDLKPVILAGFA